MYVHSYKIMSEKRAEKCEGKVCHCFLPEISLLLWQASLLQCFLSHLQLFFLISSFSLL